MNEALKRRISNLSPDRIKALVGTLNQTPVIRPLMPRNRAQRYPLSAAQERLWFLSQLSPKSPAFNNPAALRIRTVQPLDHTHLSHAFDAMGRRHEILRTTFRLEEDRPVQVIHDAMPLTVEWRNLRDIPDREVEALRQACEEGRRHFDLASGPLIALTVLELGRTEYILLITSHHIISDGWSNAIFASELPAIYEGQELPALDVQYIDYVHWEREWLDGVACKEQLSYWHDKLDYNAPPLALPTNNSRPSTISHAGGMESHSLPPMTAERLRLFARQERVSLFPIMMATLAALLYRFSGACRIPIGTIAANRNERTFQKVIGPFLNTLVIPCEVEDGQTLHSLLRTVNETCREALRRQELPFNVLLNALKVRREYGVHPLFQVMLVYQNVPSQYESSGMNTEVLKVDYRTTKFDLNFWIEEINDALVVTLYYASDLFAPATIHWISANYQRMIECLIDQPDVPIDDLPIFVVPSAAPLHPVTVSESFIACFERQALLTPDCAAVWGVGGTLTYKELDQAANRIAQHLRQRGAVKDTPIGLLAARDELMIVALLGILKSGAPYLPLNPSDPPVRWRNLLDDADAKILVADARYVAHTATLPVDIVDMSAIPEDVDLEAAPGRTVAPEDLAYLIYTSGSTGAPKGVCVEHRNLVAYADGVWERMALEAGDRLAIVTPIATDLGNTMIFPPLAHGGCVVVVPEEAVVDATVLSQLFVQNAVDCLKITPTHLQALLDRPGLLPRKLLILGGEACDAALIDRIRSFRPGLRILNHYGPTETTVGVLTHELPDPWSGGSPPLGKPIGGVYVDICDHKGHPLPQGIVGEIVVGGATVSRGYWKRPDITAKCFVAEPSNGGVRYRTGDLGKLYEDGSIGFHGRVDRQIKLRGHRIELGEIESVLMAHPLVAQAVVRLDPPGRLVAFVVVASPITDGTLINFLKDRLPTIMIPGVFVFLDALPRTASGKVDLAGLPDTTATGRVDSTGPRDEIELALTLMWSNLLECDSVGIHDDFFDIGGHSLIAVQLMARIRERFGRELPLACLFEHGTIAALAALLRADGASVDGSLVTIRPGNTEPPLVLVHPAGGDVLCYYPLVQGIDAPCAVIGVRARTDDGGASISAMARRYFDALSGETPEVLAGWSMGALVAFEMARLFEKERGIAPLVAILDQAAQSEVADAIEKDDLVGMQIFARKVSELVGSDIGIDPAWLELQAEQDRSAAFLNAFKRHGLAPEETRLEDFDRYLRLMLAHNRSTQAYHPECYAGEVVLFRAESALTQDGKAEPEREPYLGWDRWCTGKLQVVAVPGNHVSMMRTPHVSVLAQLLTDTLRLGWQGPLLRPIDDPTTTHSER